jgi:hypothetical protein
MEYSNFYFYFFSLNFFYKLKFTLWFSPLKLQWQENQIIKKNYCYFLMEKWKKIQIQLQSAPKKMAWYNGDHF